jgi:hypothetical protein
VFFREHERPSFTPVLGYRPTYSSVYFNLYVFG